MPRSRLRSLACLAGFAGLLGFARLSASEADVSGAEVSVHVLGPEGAPVEGARVEMWRDARRDGLLEVERTGAKRAAGRPLGKGEYRCVLTAPGVYRLRVEAAGFARSLTEAVVSGREPVTLRLEPERLIRGCVLDIAGKPIEGAEIHAGVFLHALGPEARARSDAGGSFALHGLSGGEIDVCASKDGFEDDDRERVCPGEPEIRLTLKRSRPFLGRVVEEEDGQPVPDAIVELSCIQWTLVQTRTDSRGFFRLDRLPAARGMARFSHDDFITRRLDGVCFDEARSDGSLVIELQRAPRVRGMLLDAMTGTPVDDAAIVTWPLEGTEACNRRGARTGVDGAFELTRLFPGTWHLRARRKGYIEAGTSLVIGDATRARELVLWLGRGGSIAGRVVDSKGQPLRGAQVTPVLASIGGEESCRPLVEQTACTDARGRFEVEGIPRGSTCYLIGSRWDMAPVWHERIELPPTGRARAIEIRLPAWGGIEGRVAEGTKALFLRSALPSCLDEDYNLSSLFWTCAVPDGSGAFTMRRAPPGSHELELVLENRDVMDGGPVIVREGETTSTEVLLDPEEP